MSTEGRVAGKVVLVVGAASGIGRATATLLAKQGAIVWCSDRDTDGAAATSGPIGGKSAGLDVTREADWQRVIATVVAEHGRLDVLVNSAGISFGCPVAEMSLDDWRRVLGVNLDGVFLGTKHAIRAMRATGGSIVNVSSAS